jgi:hypothetical protein
MGCACQWKGNDVVGFCGAHYAAAYKWWIKDLEELQRQKENSQAAVTPQQALDSLNRVECNPPPSGGGKRDN